MLETKTVAAILNGPKKHSTRYDLFIEGKEQPIGSIYWPKDSGDLPKTLTVIKAE